MSGTNKKLTLLEREEKLIEVELLMLKGIQNPSKIAKKIKTSFPFKAYISRKIKARKNKCRPYQ